MKKEEFFKSLNGVVVTFDIDDKEYKKIEKNKKVIDLWLFTKNEKKDKKFSKEKGSSKAVLPRKIYKLFKKKSVDAVIIDITNIYKNLDDIMYSAYKMSDKVYIYGKLEPYLINYIISKYNRHYKITFDVKQDYIELNIDMSNKKNKILEPFYVIYDFLYKLLDAIGTVLMG